MTISYYSNYLLLDLQTITKLVLQFKSNNKINSEIFEKHTEINCSGQKCGPYKNLTFRFCLPLKSSQQSKVSIFIIRSIYVSIYVSATQWRSVHKQTNYGMSILAYQ